MDAARRNRAASLLDARGTSIPAMGRPDFEFWRTKVNDYFADPKNANRELPDAMKAVGDQISLERLKRYGERNQRSPAPVPSPS